MTRAILLGSLAACALVSCARGEPRAVLSNASVDFGSVMQGTPAAPEFVVSNEGTAALQIQRINITAPIKVVATKMPGQIAPGAQATIRLNLDTSKIEGPVEGEIALFLNDPAAPEVRLTLTGRVVPPIEIAPMPALFVSVGRGERARSSVEIINHDSQPLHIEAVEHATDRFTTSLDTLEEGQRYKLNLFLNGTGAGGRRNDPITIRTSNAARPTITLAANTLILERVYTFPDAVEMGAFPIGTITMAPAVANTLAQTLMVYRKGGGVFEVSATTDVPYLRVEGERGPEGDRYQLTISLVADKVQPGPIRGTVVIHTNDREFPRLTVPVSGRILP